MDEKNLRIFLPKCYFPKLEIILLGYQISQADISPLESKTSAILPLETAKTLKKVRFFLSLVHNIDDFNPNIAQISHPLRPLLKKSSKFIWTDVHENCFSEIKNCFENIT